MKSFNLYVIVCISFACCVTCLNYKHSATNTLTRKPVELAKNEPDHSEKDTSKGEVKEPNKAKPKSSINSIISHNSVSSSDSYRTASSYRFTSSDQKSLVWLISFTAFVCFLISIYFVIRIERRSLNDNLLMNILYENRPLLMTGSHAEYVKEEIQNKIFYVFGNPQVIEPSFIPDLDLKLQTNYEIIKVEVEEYVKGKKKGVDYTTDGEVNYENGILLRKKTENFQETKSPQWDVFKSQYYHAKVEVSNYNVLVDVSKLNYVIDSATKEDESVSSYKFPETQEAAEMMKAYFSKHSKGRLISCVIKEGYVYVIRDREVSKDTFNPLTFNFIPKVDLRVKVFFAKFQVMSALGGGEPILSETGEVIKSESGFPKIKLKPFVTGIEKDTSLCCKVSQECYSVDWYLPRIPDNGNPILESEQRYVKNIWSHRVLLLIVQMTSCYGLLLFPIIDMDEIPWVGHLTHLSGIVLSIFLGLIVYLVVAGLVNLLKRVYITGILLTIAFGLFLMCLWLFPESKIHSFVHGYQHHNRAAVQDFQFVHTPKLNLDLEKHHASSVSSGTDTSSLDQSIANLKANSQKVKNKAKKKSPERFF